MLRRRAASLLAWVPLLLAAALLPIVALADEPNQAGLVVQSGKGEVETRCVAFQEDEISGAELLARAELDVILDPASSMGVTVCQIEGMGCNFPVQPCFCQCMGGGDCAYWNYFYRDPGQSEWVYSALGAALRKVSNRSVEAWVWGDGHAPPTGSVSFEAICIPPTPTPTDTPEPPTPLPATTAPRAAPTQAQAPTQPATATPTAPPALPTPTLPASAGSGPTLLSYWPFGLMVLGLVLAGLVVRLRRP